MIFSQVPLIEVEPPTIVADIVNDTGISDSDRLTLDPTINGQTTGATSLLANLNGNGFVDLSSALKEDGSFTVSFEQYEVLSNGGLPNGDYTLQLKAQNSSGQESEIVTVSFTLDLVAPSVSFELAPESDTGVLGDKITTERNVKLIGQTEPGLEVVLVETQQRVTADSTGTFTFTDVPMSVAGQAPLTMVTVDAAGNQGQVRQFLTREGINGAPEITSTPETIFDNTQQTTYVYQIVATDPDGDALTYTLLNAPEGVEIDENGRLSFTPSGILQPFYDFSVEVSDGRGGTDSQAFTLELPVISAALGTIRGIKWNDLNGNGFRDTQLVQGNEPDVIFTIDVSGSADFAFAGTSIGDLNGDRLINTRLDAEIASFLALNQQLIQQGLGTKAQVGIVVFSGFAAQADMDLVTSGVQLATTPTADKNNNGIFDVEEILRSIRSGAFGVGNNTGTNFEVALQRVENTFTTLGTAFGDANLVFLSDGEINRGGSINDEVNRLKNNFGANLSAFGVGRDASLPSLRLIDPNAKIFTTTDELLGVFGGLGSGEEIFIEPGLAGVSVYLDANNNGILDPGEPVQVTAEDDPNTPDINETGQYQFTNLLPGIYTVREIVPQGFEQTFPSTQFHTVKLQSGQIVENINFGNVEIQNRDPVITSTPPTEAILGQPYEYPVQAQDPDGDIINFSLNEAPEGMVIDPDTGLISYTPTTKTLNFDTSDSRIRPNLDNQRALTDDNQGIRFIDSILTANYAIGEGYNLSSNRPVGPVFRGVVSFDLSSLDRTVTSAKLQLQKYNTSGDPIEILGLFDVSTDKNILYGIPGDESPVIYQDLGSGRSYGTFDVATGGNPNEVLEFELNEAAIADINAGVGDFFSIGLSLLSINPNNQTSSAEYLFARGSSAGVQRLVLETIDREQPVEILIRDDKGGEVTQNYNLSIFDNAINRNPKIISTPDLNATLGATYNYQVIATDPNADPLTYRLINAPEGMKVSEFGLITWLPTEGDLIPVEIEVSDGRGGLTTQNYSINIIDVPADTEAPQVNLGFSGTVLKLGQSLNLQIQGFDNVGLADLDLSVNGESLTLNSANIEQGVIYTASFTPDRPGIFEVLATATDFGGNRDTETLSVRVLDPNDTSAPIAQLDISDFDPLNLVIREKTEIKGTINDENLEFYRVELAPVSLVDLSKPAAKDPDYITIAQGTGNIDGVLANIDPALYRNDNYFVRIYAQDINGNVTVEGFGVGIDSQTKPGEFSLEFTDLSIPLTGIPIEVTRGYSSLDANFQGDFGYGWELGLQDAQIVESAPTGVDLNFDDFFGGNSFTEGTRVTLTNPDGRRVGFTFTPEVFSPGAGIFLGPEFYAWRPKFTPDPGVYETLEVPYVPIMRLSDGSFGLYLFGFTYNPSDYTLTTRDGTKYNYNQDQGLKTVKDRNGNTLTFTDKGIASSTGAKIDFIRDAKGRITEIVDPDGKSLKYSYDANGNLIEFGDRTDNETTFEYEAEREHYLTEIIDPLNRTSVRTEYDENGQISKIFDADGNALDINYDSATSRQTVKDPFGNTTTYVFDPRGNVVSQIDALAGVTARTYDANNNLLSETNPEGNTKSYTYDSRGNKLSETDGEGNTKTYTYNTRNDILTETDALGNTTTYSYDANGNLTSRKDALGNVTNYKYGQYGLLTEVVDANGKTSTFSYDFYGNLTELIDPTGAKTTFTYDRNGRVASVTDALGAITNYIYDAQGRLIEKADPEGSSCGCARGITKTEYNAAGEKIAEIDALGRRTEYRYNSRGLLIETIYPDSTPDDLSDNPRTKNEYDAADRLIVTVDELGRQTHYIYDKLGRQIETIYPDSTPDDLSDNPRTRKEYDSAGRVIADLDELGNRTEYDYDQSDRLITTTNALGEVTSYIYDADGRQIAMTDALGRTTNYAYDALDRLITTTYANNTAMSTTYDPLGRIVAQTDLAGITTNYEYDALGRLTAVVDALNQRTEYKYDAVGNLIEQKDANGQITKFEYDSLRRRKAMILPGGQRNETIHNKIGNLIRVTDFNGVTTTYEYNERNWLTEKSFSDGTATETFTYTLTGELATVTDNRGVTSYVYDERDRLLSRTEPDLRTIEYSYDAKGNILSLIVPSGVTSYTYDALNRLDTVIDPDGGITDYTYDAVGNLIKTEFPNGTSENQQYDLLNRLTYLENRDQTGIISSYTYSLDAMGNRTKVVENDGRTVEYSYDDLYRLTQEKITDPVAGNKVIEYTFDPVGNRLERIDSVEGTTTYSYDVNDRLIEEVLGGKVTNYQYDAKGNLTAKVENGQTRAEYEWNAKGELVAVEVTENGETGRIEFEYDHTGIRVAIKANGEETRFLIDNNQQQYAQVIEEYQPNGTVDKSYIHGIDLISQEDVNGRIYYQMDGLGSTRLLTDDNGAIVVEYDYDAYGNLTRKLGDADNSYLFAGEQFDEATDDYYLRARYYDHATGRFASTDPFEGYNNQPVTLHDYLYGNNNPVIFVDPSGEVSIIMTAIKGAGILAITGGVFGLGNKPINCPNLNDVGDRFVSGIVGFVAGGVLGGTIGAGIGYLLGGALGTTAIATFAVGPIGPRRLAGAIGIFFTALNGPQKVTPQSLIDATCEIVEEMNPNLR